MDEKAPAENKALFKDKMVVCSDKLENVVADDAVLVNFCTPTILQGPLAEKVCAMAGPELREACGRYHGMCPTSCRTTPAFAAKNFLNIVHSLVPAVLDLSDAIDIKKFYACVRNALDAATQAGAKTIVVPSLFPGVDTEATCELVLRIFIVWIHCSPYSEKVSKIIVVCSADSDFQLYQDAVNSLYSQVFEVGQPIEVGFAQCEALMAASGHSESLDSRTRKRRRHHHVKPPSQAPGYAASVHLELSAKLASTILVIDDEHGNKRQYRVTNKSRDGSRLYFRCSRCDTLIKKDGINIRAKLIFQDGGIIGDPYPQHHPHCKPMSQEDIFVQQVDRTSRRDVKEGKCLPRDAYEIAADKVLAVSEKNPAFGGELPEWPRLRQQYLRIMKTAMRKRAMQPEDRIGLSHKKYSPTGESTVVASPSATRRTTRSLHGQKQLVQHQQLYNAVQSGHMEAIAGGCGSEFYHQTLLSYLKAEMGQQQHENIRMEVIEDDGGIIEEMMDDDDEMDDAIINVDDDVTITPNELFAPN